MGSVAVVVIGVVVVAVEVPTGDIIDEPIFVIVDAITWDFPRIDKHIRNEIGMIEIYAAVQYGNHDSCTTSVFDRISIIRIGERTNSIDSPGDGFNKCLNFAVKFNKSDRGIVEKIRNGLRRQFGGNRGDNGVTVVNFTPQITDLLGGIGLGGCGGLGFCFEANDNPNFFIFRDTHLRLRKCNRRGESHRRSDRKDKERTHDRGHKSLPEKKK